METKNPATEAALRQRCWTRRKALTAFGGGVAALGLGLYGYAGFVEPQWIELVERELPIRRLPAALEGKTLIQISDLHVSPIVDPHYLRAAFAWVSQLKPDILCVTGDFMTPGETELLDEVSAVLRGFPQGRLATLAVLGNHDYGHTWKNKATADALAPRLRDAGIDLLRNEVRDIQGLKVVGMDDFWSGRLDLKPTLGQVKPNEASLTLCHNPDAVDEPHWNWWQGWILSGHTHGGQVKPPFLPPPLLPVKNKRYTSGAFDLFDGRWLYINRGLGFIKKVRFNARPEITCFTLRRARA